MIVFKAIDLQNLQGASAMRSYIKESALKIVLCSCPAADAPNWARQLVEQKLAACINLIPGVQSVYRWEERICEDPETLMVIKTADNQIEALKSALIALHSYDLPEFLALNIDEVHSHHPYLDWVNASTTCSF